MSNREIMKALIKGESVGFTPQWFISFESAGLVERLLPEGLLYYGYSEYPDRDRYGYKPMGEELLQKERNFNQYIDKCAFPVGWGANAAFGHCGPGEYNKRVVERLDDRYIVEYETGVKREVRLEPHFVHIYGHPVKSIEDIKGLILPDPIDAERYDGIKQDILWAKEKGEWTVAWVNGFFSGIHYFFREYTQFFMDFIENPEMLKALIKINGEWTLEAARMLCESGVDCIGFCDDLGSENSMIISPWAYREFIRPWHARLCSLAHDYGVVVHMHSHGAIMPVLKDIAEAGIDILNPLDPGEGMMLEKAREIAGPKLVLCGGLDKHFFDWSRDKQANYLKYTVKKGRVLGPHILMDSGGIPGNVTRKDFDWFLNASAEIRYMNK